MDINQLKWKIILGVVFAILVAIIITLAVVLGTRSSDNQEQCQFVDSRPSVEVSTDIASDDFTALARFSGFVGIFKDGREQYLPLKLLKVSAESASILRLWTDCAEATLWIKQDDDNKQYTVASFDVSLEKPIPYRQTNVSYPLESLESCNVSPTGITFGQYEGYVCNDSKQNTCQTNDESLAVFVVDSIKFEINGDPEKIKRGEYSKPSHYC